MTINILLFQQIKQHILEEPKRFDMSIFGYSIHQSNTYHRPFNDINLPDCGTVACICGWTNALTSDISSMTFEFDDMTRAAKILGIHPEYVDRIFHIGSWPKRFIDEIRSCKNGTEDYARAAARFIDFVCENSDKLSLPWNEWFLL